MGAAGGLLTAFLVLASVQYSYRYILRMSDHATSPDYINTPLWIGAAKAVLLVLPVLVLVFSRERATVERHRWLTALSLLIGVGLVVQGGAFLSQVIRGVPLTNIVFAVWYFWLYPLVAILLCFAVGSATARRSLASFALWMFVISFGFWLVEVFLYLAHGRLPALSYPGAPRFGSVLDDPNGFAVLVVLLYAIHLTLTTRWKYFTLPALAVMLLGTFSLSGYLVFFVFLLQLFVARLRAGSGRRLAMAVTPALVAALVAVAILLATPVTSGPGALVKGKLRSVEIHLTDLTHPWHSAAKVDVANVLFGSKSGGSETLYWRLLDRDGLLVMLLFSAAAVLVALRASRSRDRLFANVGAWGLAVLVGSFFIPYLQVYPINLYFWTLLVMAPLSARRPSS